jgi:hypothetical protein
MQRQMIDVAVKSPEGQCAAAELWVQDAELMRLLGIGFNIMLNNQYSLNSLLRVSRGNGYA